MHSENYHQIFVSQAEYLKKFNFLSLNYEILDILGEGSYGSVVRAKHKSTGQFVAIKRIEKLFENLQDTKKILREVQLLKELNHTNVVKLLDAEIEFEESVPKVIYLIFECLPTDLWKLVRSGLYLEMDTVNYILYQILKAVYYIHSKNVLHRDLKSGNILLDRESFEIKICDFGLARTVKYDKEVNLYNEKTIKKEEGGLYSEEVNNVINSTNDNKHYSNVDADTLHSPFTSTTTKTSQTSINKVTAGIQNTNISTNNNTSTTTNESSNKTTNPPTTTNVKGNFNINNLLKRKQEMIQQKKSSSQMLSHHVATRWYRAPELILIEKQYGEPVDIWAIGCIFAELLFLNLKQKGKVLFRGNLCYPLSPIKEEDAKRFKQSLKLGYSTKLKDQLDTIFDVIGTPEEDDLHFITAKEPYDYVKYHFTKREKQDFQQVFPNLSNEGANLIESMLKFDPLKRPTAEQCLNHPYIKDFTNNFQEFLSQKNNIYNSNNNSNLNKDGKDDKILSFYYDDFNVDDKNNEVYLKKKEELLNEVYNIISEIRNDSNLNKNNYSNSNNMKA